MNIYDYLLQFYTGNDTVYRSNFTIPSLQSDHVYASNGVVLIRIDKHLLHGNYSDSKESPNYTEFMGDFLDAKSNDIDLDIIKKDELLNIVAQFKLKAVRGKIKCKKCDGTGIKTCKHCENESDCKKCEGTGEADDINGTMIKDVWTEDENGGVLSYFLFKDRYKISPMYVDLLLFSMVCIGINHASFYFHKSGLIFLLDGIIILIMTKQ
jgi:hypothetical protein